MKTVRRRGDSELLPSEPLRWAWPRLPVLPSRAISRVDAALPEVLEAMARSLRAGASLRTAVVDAGAAAPAPLGDDLRTITSAVELGRPLSEAIDAWAAESRAEGVPLAAAALGL